MSVTVRTQVRCDMPGCYAKFSYFGRVLNTTDMRRAAPPGWRLPKTGDPSDAPCFCPSHAEAS